MWLIPYGLIGINIGWYRQFTVFYQWWSCIWLVSNERSYFSHSHSENLAFLNDIFTKISSKNCRISRFSGYQIFELVQQFFGDIFKNILNWNTRFQYDNKKNRGFRLISKSQFWWSKFGDEVVDRVMHL